MISIVETNNRVMIPTVVPQDYDRVMVQAI